MKLDRLAFSQSFLGLALVATVALACGCSSPAVVPGCTASSPARDRPSVEAANVAGTTNLMSAQLAGPAPRVGKSHLVVDDLANDDIESSSTSVLDAPKEARPSDGSRRGGGFGSSK